MPTYPSLSTNPSGSDFREGPVIDPTLRSEFENGAVLTRARFTAVPKRWDIRYLYMSNADKVTLQTFESATVNYGAAVFDWTSPADSETYSVRFGAPIKFRVAPDAPAYWNVSFILIEEYPGSEV